MMFDNYRSAGKIILALLICALLTPLAAGERITVKSSGLALEKQLARSRQGDTLVLEPGLYRGKFVIPPRVTVISQELHKAVINGSGQNRAVILMNGAVIYGLSICGAKVGVYSEGIDNEIKGCRIYGNRHSGIVSVANLPLIKDNLIYRNQGSGITLWDARSRNGSISHNTIVFNTNHGISAGGVSEISVTDNIIAYNSKLKIKAEESSKITQQNNNYYYNIEINEILPEENFSFEPLFRNAAANDFRLTELSRCINNGSNGSTIGSEIFTNFKN